MNLSDVAAPDEVSEGWWNATREHRYVVQQCELCGAVQHPPRALCTTCYETARLSFVPATGRGVVDACTSVHRGPRPDVEVPYVVGRVRLDEGPIVLTQLIGAEEFDIGDRVSVQWVDLDDGRALPVFGHLPLVSDESGEGPHAAHHPA